MHTSRTPLFALLVCVLCSCTVLTLHTSPSHAQSSAASSAEGYYKEGISLVSEKKYAEAAEKFVLAFGLDPNTTLAFNAGRAYENAGDLEKAKVYYGIVLQRDPPPNLLAQTEASLERISKSLERITALERDKPTTLSIKINANDNDASVYVDGALLGNSPQTFTGKPGSHTVEILRKGYEPFYQSVSGEAGTELSVIAALEEKSTISWIGWTGLGMSVVGLGIGLAAIPYSNDAQSAYDEAQDVRSQRNSVAFDELRTQGESDRDFSTALITSGSVLGAVGVSLLVFDLFTSNIDSAPTPTYQASKTPAALRVFFAPNQATLQATW